MNISEIQEKIAEGFLLGIAGNERLVDSGDVNDLLKVVRKIQKRKTLEAEGFVYFKNLAMRSYSTGIYYKGGFAKPQGKQYLVRSETHCYEQETLIIEEVYQNLVRGDTVLVPFDEDEKESVYYEHLHAEKGGRVYKGAFVRPTIEDGPYRVTIINDPRIKFFLYEESIQSLIGGRTITIILS